MVWVPGSEFRQMYQKYPTSSISSEPDPIVPKANTIAIVWRK
jgi:hypothetical protein